MWLCGCVNAWACVCVPLSLYTDERPTADVDEEDDDEPVVDVADVVPPFDCLTTRWMAHPLLMSAKDTSKCVCSTHVCTYIST